MAKKIAVAVMLSLFVRAGMTSAQECLHGPNEDASQAGRRRDALTAARTINNLEANQTGAVNRIYLRQSDLANSPFAMTLHDSPNETIKRLSLSPNSEIVPGWKLELDVTENGYWFAIRDLRDPCGFRFVSNQSGLILRAEPIR
jgi:hypothetical protein